MKSQKMCVPWKRFFYFYPLCITKRNVYVVRLHLIWSNLLKLLDFLNYRGKGPEYRLEYYTPSQILLKQRRC